eukprot:scaffold29_cov364-Pavlova_lutheri.AAC.7
MPLVGTMMKMVKHTLDTTHLLARKILVDETTHFYTSKDKNVDQNDPLQARRVAFLDVWTTHDFRICELWKLTRLAEASTFVLMRAKGIRQVR